MSSPAKTPIISESAATPSVEEETKPQQPVLSPAPVPTTSPWKSLGAVGSAPASGKWPSAQEAVGQLERREKTSMQGPAIKSTGKEKWVPMKASIVVSGPKRFGNNGNSNSGSSNGSGSSGPRKPQSGKKTRRGNASQINSSGGSATSRPKKVGTSEKPETADKDISTEDVAGGKITPAVAADNTDSGSEAAGSHSGSGAAADETTPGQNATEPSRSNNEGETTKEAFQSQPHQPKSGFHRRPHPHGQSNGLPRRRFHQGNQTDGHGSFRPSQSHPHYPSRHSYGPFRQHPSNRAHNLGYRPKFNHRNAPNDMYLSQPPHPFVAVNNIARQIEYYFSAENLAKDDYLRSQFDQQGFASLALIAKFYRIVNMSFGGDQTLILGALREIVANEHATVNVAQRGEQDLSENKLDNYLVRSKSWQQWVSQEGKAEEGEQEEPCATSNQRILVESDLDCFRIEPPVFDPTPAVPESQHNEPYHAEPEVQGNVETN
ncbi:LADA_0H01068g1_1 [Lachancea dasiensis]|uniref:LADA_0H01068g1_1 n=1 Tax=Lachancea dasiensis TaxID=1072105 RepID=A0A1G4JZ52_9SACH|nr:LADA_0H01068g1_1 [Lachancea dasiensis]